MYTSTRGAGPVILLVHGLPTNHRLWERFIPHLLPHFRCIAVDLPGFGTSKPLAEGSLNPDDFATALHTLQARMEIERWHIIGHDAGAAIAAHFAARFPQAVDRLVLASPPIYPEHQIPWFFRPLRAPVVGELLAPLAAKLIFDAGLVQAIDEGADRSALIRSFQAPFLGKDGARHLLHVLRWGDPTKVLATTASLLPDITAPTLVLHGARDQAIPIDFAQRAAQDVADGQCLLADATHFLPLNEPRWMAARILPFLAGALRGCTE